MVEGRESEKKGGSGTVHSLEGEDHACGSPVVRSSLHRFLKVPCVVRRARIGKARQGKARQGKARQLAVWLCLLVAYARERARGFPVSAVGTVRAQSLDRRPPEVAGAVAGLGLRERAVQSNLNRRARPTRGHRQSLLRLDVTRGSSCMPRATHAPIPRTILSARVVPAILQQQQQQHHQHQPQYHRRASRFGAVLEADGRLDRSWSSRVRSRPLFSFRSPFAVRRLPRISYDGSARVPIVVHRRQCRDTSSTADGHGEEKEESCGEVRCARARLVRRSTLPTNRDSLVSIFK